MPFSLPLASRLDASLAQRDRNRSTARRAIVDRASDARINSAIEPERATARAAFPIRLRYLILLIVALILLRSFALRALAYWQLHEAASTLANYAVCMAGPTGPELVHQRPKEFWRLVRRRLLASAADARPFAPCAQALEAYAGSSRRPAHEARAGEFREYGVLRAEAKAGFEVADLTVSSERLSELRATAWPFAAGDLESLLRPERSAKAAPHPSEPARAALGRGLPAIELGYSSVSSTGAGFLLVEGQGANTRAYRSDDGGTNWIEVDAGEPAAAALAGGCSSGEGRAQFRLRETGDQLRVDSWLNGELESSFALAAAESRLLAFACDASAAVAITTAADRRLAFRLCPQRAPCKALSVPPVLRSPLADGTSLSIARAKSVSVIAMARDGVVRIISSRDDGETWTPPIVAYDRAEQSDAPAPTHLLGLGSKLLLYSGGRSSTELYSTLYSTDFGASWQGR
jgi:hypothetical protein